MLEYLLRCISIFLAILIVIPAHEFAHAFAAVKSGDITPKLQGRYTLNPLSHFDPLGIVCFIFAGFGWAKPVIVNPDNFRNRKLGSFFVAIAGVTANFIIAFLFYPLFLLSQNIPQFGYFTIVLQDALYYVFWLSLIFFVFNLLPIYPLDGFRVLESFIRSDNPFMRFMRTYGHYILLFLIVLSFIAERTGIYYLDVLGIVINFLTGYLAKPITLFWGLIF